MATAFKPMPEETVSQFDLQQEIDMAEARRPWPAGIYSKTLLKKQDMRVVLTLMEPGAVMKDHHADGSVAIQVLLGKLQLILDGDKYKLLDRSLFVVPPSVRHRLQALEPTAFLLTISWPDNEKLRAMPHRGYGS